MAETVTVLPNTNENMYDILWSARTRIFQERFGHIEDLYEALDAFVEADINHYWRAEAVTGSRGPGEPEELFLTGKVDVVPRPAESVRTLLESSQRTQAQRTEILRRFLSVENDAVAELGAGYGLGLFRLAQSLREEPQGGTGTSDLTLIMAEYTRSGRALCAEFLRRQNAPAMQVHAIDHKAPDVSFLSAFSFPLVCTVHSIEQVPHLPDDYFHVLAKAAPRVRGVHIEPVGFQFDASTEKRRTHAAYVAKKNWNRNFADVIKRAEQDGVLVIDTVELDTYVIHEGNPASIIAWHTT